MISLGLLRSTVTPPNPPYLNIHCFCTCMCVCIRTVRPYKFCPLSCLGNRQQDDITQSGDHLWTQPLAQAEKGQRVCCAEFCSSRGEHGHHQRGPKDDPDIPLALYGKKWPVKTRGHANRAPTLRSLAFH